MLAGHWDPFGSGPPETHMRRGEGDDNVRALLIRWHPGGQNTISRLTTLFAADHVAQTPPLRAGAPGR